ncbi:MAG: hypothetical protein AAF557_12425, partial [Pseudomonadota bacterium]
SGWNAALMLLQHRNDLLFAEPRSLHNPSPSLGRILPQSGGGNGSQDNMLTLKVKLLLVGFRKATQTQSCLMDSVYCLLNIFIIF